MKKQLYCVVYTHPDFESPYIVHVMARARAEASEIADRRFMEDMYPEKRPVDKGPSDDEDTEIECLVIPVIDKEILNND